MVTPSSCANAAKYATSATDEYFGAQHGPKVISSALFCAANTFHARLNSTARPTLHAPLHEPRTLRHRLPTTTSYEYGRNAVLGCCARNASITENSLTIAR